MIAKQSVYLNAAQTQAVVEGDREARTLLCRVGTEVNERLLEKHEGAFTLANSQATKETPAAPVAAVPVVNRDPQLETQGAPVAAVKEAVKAKSKGRPKKASKTPADETYKY